MSGQVQVTPVINMAALIKCGFIIISNLQTILIGKFLKEVFNEFSVGSTLTQHQVYVVCGSYLGQQTRED